MPLKGITVLEFAGLAPGPFCGMLLADFGATVIRIDKTKGNSPFDVLSNGKSSVAVNLKKPEGTDIIRKLTKQSDVLIEPFRAGVMESLKLGPSDLLKENPQLIYARLTGFGQKGLYSKRAGHDINYIAISGILSMFGRAGQKPTFPVNYAADFAGGGLTCALGILVALFERSRSGKGQIVDSSMVEGSAYLSSWLYRSRTLPFWGRKTGENVLDSGAHFYDVFETKDGKYMSVGAIEPEFYDRLLEVLEIGELDQFNFETGKVLLTKKFLEKTQSEWCELFDGKDACVFPVLDYDSVSQHPHNKENNAFVKENDLVIPQPAPKLSRTPAVSKHAKAKPEIGQNTIEVLLDLGYSKERIMELKANGVVRTYDAKL